MALTYNRREGSPDLKPEAKKRINVPTPHTSESPQMMTPRPVEVTVVTRPVQAQPAVLPQSIASVQRTQVVQ